MTNKITVADSRLINWLLFESGKSRYAISRDVGISESTLSRIVNGFTTIEQMRFGYAHKLTNYAKALLTDNADELQVKQLLHETTYDDKDINRKRDDSH